MASMSKKRLVLGKAQWKKKRKLRNCMRFGWRIASAKEVTTETKEEKYGARWVSDDTVEIYDASETHYSTEYYVDLYRYDDEVPNINSVKIKEVFYNLVGKLKVLGAILFPILLLASGAFAGSTTFEIFGVLIVSIVIEWNLGNLLENIISRSAEKTIEKGW